MGFSCSKPQRKERFEPPVRAKWDSDSNLDLELDSDAEAEGSLSSLEMAPHTAVSSTVMKIAALLRAEHLPNLSVALPIQSSDRRKIINMFPGQVEKQAAALMHFWLNSQPHPSEEKLLGQLRGVGLNYDWVRGGARPGGGADGRLKSDLQAEEKIDKETQTEKVNLRMESRTVTKLVADKQTETERGATRETQREEGNFQMESRTVTRFVDMQTKPVQVLETPWTSTELYNWLKEAPDHLTKPVYFYKHLRTFCIAYKPHPAQVRSLLESAYDSTWEKVKQHFCVPGADADADWPDAAAMATWLETKCLHSVNTAARSNPDFYAAISCSQKPKESVSDFLSRYQEMWDSAWGDTCSGLATITLFNQLQSHIVELFQLKVTAWESLSLAKVISCLKTMDSHGWFESKRRTLNVIQEHNRVLEESSSEELEQSALAPYGRPRRGKRRGRCYYCGRFGHWIRECRAATRQRPQQLALGWEYMD